MFPCHFKVYCLDVTKYMVLKSIFFQFPRETPRWELPLTMKPFAFRNPQSPLVHSGDVTTSPEKLASAPLPSQWVVGWACHSGRYLEVSTALILDLISSIWKGLVR